MVKGTGLAGNYGFGTLSDTRPFINYIFKSLSLHMTETEKWSKNTDKKAVIKNADMSGDLSLLEFKSMDCFVGC